MTMYLELLCEARSLMEKAVAEAGYASPDMYLGESAHADVSSALPFRLGKELRKTPPRSRRRSSLRWARAST